MLSVDTIYKILYETGMAEDYFLLFKEYSLKYDLASDDGFWQKMADLYALVLLWGTKINLTSNLGPKNFFLENIADPLCAYMAMEKNEQGRQNKSSGSYLIDLGCGGGFVGFVWHLASKGGFITQLVDSDRRKINFCKQVIRELKLEKIIAAQCRAEDLKIESASCCDVIVSRATWNFTEFVRISKKLRASQTRVFYFSGTRKEGFENDIKLINYEISKSPEIKRQLWQA